MWVLRRRFFGAVFYYPELHLHPNFGVKLLLLISAHINGAPNVHGFVDFYLTLFVKLLRLVLSCHIVCLYISSKFIPTAVLIIVFVESVTDLPNFVTFSWLSPLGQVDTGQVETLSQGTPILSQAAPHLSLAAPSLILPLYCLKLATNLLFYSANTCIVSSCPNAVSSYPYTVSSCPSAVKSTPILYQTTPTLSHSTHLCWVPVWKYKTVFSSVFYGWTGNTER